MCAQEEGWDRFGDSDPHSTAPPNLWQTDVKRRDLPVAVKEVVEEVVVVVEVEEEEGVEGRVLDHQGVGCVGVGAQPVAWRVPPRS